MEYSYSIEATFLPVSITNLVTYYYVGTSHHCHLHRYVDELRRMYASIMLQR